jgi:hypothetical protein
MKTNVNKTAYASNLSSHSIKGNGSPSLKENTQLASSKLLNLLKPKVDTTQKQRVLYSSNLPQESNPFSNLYHHSSSINYTEHESSFLNKADKSAREKSGKTKKSADPIQTVSSRNQPTDPYIIKPQKKENAFNGLSKVGESSFRSPPVAQKNIPSNALANNLLSINKATLFNNPRKEVAPISNVAQRVFLNGSNVQTLASPPKGRETQQQSFNSNAKNFLTMMSPKTAYKGSFIGLKSKGQVNANCLVHQEKKAKFYAKALPDDNGTIALDSSIHGYCSKCAVTLVKHNVECVELDSLDKVEISCQKCSNGDTCFKCKKDTPKHNELNASRLTPEEKNRQERISSFLGEIGRQKNICSQTLETILKRGEEYELANGKGIRDINNYFNEIYEFLESKRKNAINQIEETNKENTERLKNPLALLSQVSDELEIIYSDINDNYHRIITKIVDSGSFNNILQKYQQELRYFTDSMSKVDCVQLNTSQVHFGKANDSLRVNFDPKIQISTANSFIIQSKVIDLDESNRQTSFNDESERFMDSLTDLAYHTDTGLDARGNNETFRSHKNDISKSDVYISFDQSGLGNRIINMKSSASEDIDGDQKQSSLLNASQKFDQMLTKINETQSQYENFYTQYLPSQERASDFRKGRHEVEEFEESIIESEERVFEIDPVNENDDWDQKQTPDLGEKMSPPLYISNHMRILTQKTTETPGNLNAGQDGSDPSNSLSKLACQKVLFKEI